MKQFDHVGLRTETPQPGERFVAKTRVWVTDPALHPFRVEWLRYTPESCVPDVLRDRPHIAYSASKMGVIGLSKSVAMDQARHGVRCNTVIPGLMNTPLVESRLLRQLGANDAATLIAKRDAQVPTGKMGTGWDVAHAVLFLASDEAAYISGVLLPVDGALSV